MKMIILKKRKSNQKVIKALSEVLNTKKVSGVNDEISHLRLLVCDLWKPDPEEKS